MDSVRMMLSESEETKEDKEKIMEISKRVSLWW